MESALTDREAVLVAAIRAALNRAAAGLPVSGVLRQALREIGEKP